MQMFITRGLGMTTAYVDTVIVAGVQVDIDNRDDITGDIDASSNYKVATSGKTAYKTSITKKSKHKVSVKTKGIV